MELPQITPRVIEAGISELRDHPAGVSLERVASREEVVDLLSSVYREMFYAALSERAY